MNDEIDDVMVDNPILRWASLISMVGYILGIIAMACLFVYAATTEFKYAYSYQLWMDFLLILTLSCVLFEKVLSYMTWRKDPEPEQIEDGDLVECVTAWGEVMVGLVHSYLGHQFIYSGGAPIIMSDGDLHMIGATVEEARQDPAHYSTNKWWLDDRFESITVLEKNNERY